jgi:hypothetical protein
MAYVLFKKLALWIIDCIREGKSINFISFVYVTKVLISVYALSKNI